MSQPQDVNKKDLLDINTEKYYFEKLRPFMQEMMRTCRTDQELFRTLEKVTNASDGFCQNKQFDELADAYQVLITAITDKAYFTTGPMKRGTEEEKNMVRNLVTKITDFLMIIKCEPRDDVKEPKVSERIGYSSPIGENEGFSSHNMKELTKPNPKNRIPNV